MAQGLSFVNSAPHKKSSVMLTLSPFHAVSCCHSITLICATLELLSALGRFQIWHIWYPRHIGQWPNLPVTQDNKPLALANRRIGVVDTAGRPWNKQQISLLGYDCSVGLR